MAAAPPNAPDRVDSTEARQGSDDRENTNNVPPTMENQHEQDNSGPNEADLAENNEESGNDSGSGQSIDQAAGELGYLSVAGPSTSPPPPTSANSTVTPVDIVRKPVPNSGVGNSSHHSDRAESHPNRSMSRTPSPNAGGHDGPMTPRNDVGPFVFDGSAGQASGVRSGTIASMDVSTATDPPPPETAPEP